MSSAKVFFKSSDLSFNILSIEIPDVFVEIIVPFFLCFSISLNTFSLCLFFLQQLQ